MSCWSGPSQSPQSQWIRERLLLPVSPAGPSAPQSQEGPVASGPGTEQAINTHARARAHTHTHTHPPKELICQLITHSSVYPKGNLPLLMLRQKKLHGQRLRTVLCPLPLFKHAGGDNLRPKNPVEKTRL